MACSDCKIYICAYCAYSVDRAYGTVDGVKISVILCHECLKNNDRCNPIAIVEVKIGPEAFLSIKRY